MNLKNIATLIKTQKKDFIRSHDSKENLKIAAYYDVNSILIGLISVFSPVFLFIISTFLVSLVKYFFNLQPLTGNAANFFIVFYLGINFSSALYAGPLFRKIYVKRKLQNISTFSKNRLLIEHFEDDFYEQEADTNIINQLKISLSLNQYQYFMTKYGSKATYQDVKTFIKNIHNIDNEIDKNQQEKYLLSTEDLKEINIAHV